MSNTTQHITSSPTSSSSSSSSQYTTSILAAALAATSSTGSLPTTTLSATQSETATSGSSCLTCSDATPVCDCAVGESCVLTSRTCTSCPAIQCLSSTSSSTDSSGDASGINNIGAIVGPVVAAVVLVGLTVGGWWWWRRRKARDLRLLGFSSSNKGYPNSKHSSRNAHSPNPPPTFRLPSSAKSSPRQAESFVSGVPNDVRGDEDGNGDSYGGGRGKGRGNFDEETYSFKARTFAVDGAGMIGAGTRRVYLGTGNINLDTYSDTGRGRDEDEGGDNDRSGEYGPGRRNRLSRQGTNGTESENPFDDARSVATSTGMSFGSTNVIPITYVPSPPGADGLGFMDEGRVGPEDVVVWGGGPGGARDPASALEEARRAAFGGTMGQAPMVDRAGRPIRPARDPGLDLRLKKVGDAATGPSAFLAHLDRISREQETQDREQDRTENVRNSVHTGKSVAPSFFSGTSEAPMIMTQRQVHVGVRQAAEVINLADAGGSNLPQQQSFAGVHGQSGGWSRNLTIDTALTDRAKQHQVARAKVVLTPTQDTPILLHRPDSGQSDHSHASDPFRDRHGDGQDATPRAVEMIYPPPPQGDPKLGSNDINKLRTIIAPPRGGTFGTVLPDDMASGNGQAVRVDSIKGANSQDVPGATWSGVDSSVGGRDSFSSFGTGSVVLGEARKVQLGPGSNLGPSARAELHQDSEYLTSSHASAVRQAPVAYRESSNSSSDRHPHLTVGTRESMISNKSFADSLLGSFPMIIPTEEEQSMMAYGSQQRMPTSLSNNTISSNMAPRLAPPSAATAISDSPLKKVNSAPVTAVPFTGVSAFPRTAHLPPTTALPPMQTAGESSGSSDDHARPGRNTIGMSMASQGSGLGGFDFKFS